MFGKRKAAQPEIKFDKENQKPIIRCSVCTGEQIAGFRDKHTGHFTEVMLIKTPKDLDVFMKMYHLTDVTKEY